MHNLSPFGSIGDPQKFHNTLKYLSLNVFCAVLWITSFHRAKACKKSFVFQSHIFSNTTYPQTNNPHQMRYLFWTFSIRRENIFEFQPPFAKLRAP